MPIQRRIGISIFLSAFALEVLLSFCVWLFGIDTNSPLIIDKIFFNWSIAAPLASWALFGIVLLILPSNIWQRFQQPIIGSIAIAAVIIVCAAVYLLRGNIFDPINRGHSPVSDEYVGWTRTAIEAKYGSPSNDRPGIYGLPPVEYVKSHDPSVTITYVRGGGTLYLSFEKKNGESVCYSSDWVPTGCILD